MSMDDPLCAAREAKRAKFACRHCGHRPRWHSKDSVMADRRDRHEQKAHGEARGMRAHIDPVAAARGTRAQMDPRDPREAERWEYRCRYCNYRPRWHEDAAVMMGRRDRHERKAHGGALDHRRR